MPFSQNRNILIGLILLLFITLIYASVSGPLGLRWSNDQTALSHIPQWTLWWQLRLPRIVLALGVGASLAAGGCAMQGLFRNPLADPTLLGLANGAGLMVAIWIVLFSSLSFVLGLYAQFFAAFLGALSVGAIIFAIAKRTHGQTAIITLLLAGLAINIIAGAGGGLLAFIASDEQLRQLSLWGMGSLAQALWPSTLAALILILIALILLWRCSGDLDLLQLGELAAHAAGLNLKKLRYQVIIAIALGVGASVAVSGIIGFIGLVVPHILRLWIGPGHRWLLPLSMLSGATLLLFADTLARTLLMPIEVPVGLITSLLGGPYFLYLLLRRKSV